MRSRMAKILAVAMVLLMGVAFSPLTDGETGWRNSVGDVVWTGMFVVFALLVGLGIATAVSALRGREHADR